MNGINHLLDGINPTLLTNYPENIKLWLLSNLPPSVHDQSCTPGLPHLEYHLCYAIAINALKAIHCFCWYAQAIIIKTWSHISNTQRTVTRAHGQSEKIQQRIDQAVATYQTSWSAIGRLTVNEEFGPWKVHFWELHQEDIHSSGWDDSRTSESHHIMSWIWQTSLQPVKVTADGGKELRSKGPHLQVYILKRVWEKVMWCEETA